MAALHLAAGSRSLTTLPYPNQWGNLVAKVVVGNATANVTCPVDPAPSVTEIVQHYSKAFLMAWVVGGVCALVAILICIVHLVTFQMQPATPRRTYYTGVVLMAPVFAITNYLPLFFPRASLLFDLVQHIYEAQALSCFGKLIFDLATDGEPDQVLAREMLIARLALEEPKKLDASPPLCFIAPCVKPVRMDAARLERLMGGINVFKVVVPLCAFIRVWIRIESKSQGVQTGAKAGLFLAENLSMSYTIYCLFQLYIVTHDLLHHYNSTSKFVAIKAILAFAVMQTMVINLVVSKFVPLDPVFSSEMQCDFWASFALCVESIMLAYAHQSAYPHAELADGGKSDKRLAEARERALALAALPKPAHGHHGDHEDNDDEHAAAKAAASASPETGLTPHPWENGADAEAAWPEDAPRRPATATGPGSAGYAGSYAGSGGQPAARGAPGANGAGERLPPHVPPPPAGPPQQGRHGSPPRRHDGEPVELRAQSNWRMLTDVPPA